MPWLGRPFIGVDNYLEALRDARFREALAHTLLFAVVTVTLELLLGCLLALAMNRAFRGRALVRAAVLVPWAIPTVVSALLWRFMFEGDAGIANALLVSLGLVRRAAGLVHPSRPRVGAGDPRRRLEDDAVRRAAAARRPAEHRRLAVRGGPHRRRLRLAAVPSRHAAAAQAGDSRGAHLPHARRLPRVRPDLRDDRRRPRHVHRADRALHASTRCCRTCGSATGRRSRSSSSPSRSRSRSATSGFSAPASRRRAP